MKNKLSVLGASVIGSYGLLKITQSKIDPYIRTFIGMSIGAGIIIKYADENPFALFIGLGISLASVLQLIDVRKGGKLSFNKSGKPVFVLHESEGVKELAPYEIPNYNIDGFTIKGLNGVFKLSDGVYGGVNSNNTAQTTFGFGSLINKIRNAGYKNPAWVNAQADNRWLNLYERSL